MSARKSRFHLENAISTWTWIFILSIVFSGFTAFSLETEMAWLNSLSVWNGFLHACMSSIYQALRETNLRYPFLVYGYDGLVTAHLLFAIAFTAVLKNPVKNKWMVQSGRVACSLIIPLAFSAGLLRGLPVFWQVTGYGFAVAGLVLLTVCYRKIKALERLLSVPVALAL